MPYFKAGDRVTLTGELWGVYTASYKTGLVVTIQDVDEDGAYEFVGRDGDWWDITANGWEVELNTDTPLENAVSMEDIASIETLGAQLGISSFEQSIHRVTGKIADLLISKNKQYANSALDPIRVFSKADRTEQLRVRADDKLSRIRNGDTSEDALIDLAGYIILMKIAEESE